MADKFLKSLNIGDGNIYKPLPLVTSDDDGKILMVTDGEWGAGYVYKPLISFTISGNTFHAEKGMTWAEWVASDYNTDGFVIQSNLVLVPEAAAPLDRVSPSDIIVDGQAYDV